jgi:hypothetical protein
MTTVGYGDIHPVESIEYMVTIGIVLFSSGIFAFIVS